MTLPESRYVYALIEEAQEITSAIVRIYNLRSTPQADGMEILAIQDVRRETLSISLLDTWKSFDVIFAFDKNLIKRYFFASLRCLILQIF